MKAAALTHIGKVRATNEDSILVHDQSQPFYMLVADGMGGHAAGEVASGMVCAELECYISGLGCSVLSELQIIEGIRFVNQRLIEAVEKDSALQGMGTTLTFAAFDEDKITIAQVGDSRAYHKRAEDIYKITKDHTYVQHLIDSGVINEGAAKDYPFKNIITRSVGMKDLEVDLFSVEWSGDDIILLCTDGLSNYLDKEMMFRILKGPNSLEEKAQKLVDIALESGGKDNISVILAQRTQEGGAL